MPPIGAIFVPFLPKTGTNFLHPLPPQSLNGSTDAFFGSNQKRFGYHTEGGQTRWAVIDPSKRDISMLRSVCCSGAFCALASLLVCFYVCLLGETWLLSSMLQSCLALICAILLLVFEPFTVEVACPSIEAFVQFLCSYLKCFLHRESTILVIIRGNGAKAPRDSLAFHPWHIRVNLYVKDTSVMKHPRHRKGKES